MKSGKVLLGVLAGFAAGAALGILFAPDKGSSTRKKISNKAHQYADEIKEKSNAFTDGVAQKFQAVKEEGSRIADNWKHKTKEADLDLKHKL